MSVGQFTNSGASVSSIVIADIHSISFPQSSVAVNVTITGAPPRQEREGRPPTKSLVIVTALQDKSSVTVAEFSQSKISKLLLGSPHSKANGGGQEIVGSPESIIV